MTRSRRPKLGLDGGTDAQIGAVVDLVRGVLGADAVAGYVYGSAVLGCLKRESDVDVFVVSRRATTTADKRALIDGLLPISGTRAASGPARSIELTIVVESDVRPWRYPPALDFQYGDWLRREFERGDVTPWSTPNPDLAVLVATVRLVAEPLFGPAAAALLDRVPDADLIEAMVAGLPDLLDEVESDTRNVILTLARIWTTVATGEIRSKDAAADWLLPRLPEMHRAVLARARAIYLGCEGERWDDLAAQVRPHAAYVIGEIHREIRARPVVATVTGSRRGPT